MIGLGFRLGHNFFLAAPSNPLDGFDNYYRPDGISTYLRPDGSYYKRPA